MTLAFDDRNMLGWDGIHCGNWCRHCSNEYSMAHHLPSQQSNGLWDLLDVTLAFDDRDMLSGLIYLLFATYNFFASYVYCVEFS